MTGAYSIPFSMMLELLMCVNLLASKKFWCRVDGVDIMCVLWGHVIS